MYTLHISVLVAVSLSLYVNILPLHRSAQLLLLPFEACVVCVIIDFFVRWDVRREPRAAAAAASSDPFQMLLAPLASLVIM